MENFRKTLDFQSGKNFLSNNNLLTPTSTREFSDKVQTINHTIYDEHILTNYNKQRYNQYIVSQRTLKEKKVANERYKAAATNAGTASATNDEEDNSPPVDFEFQKGSQKLIFEPSLRVAIKQEKLFVLKPIGRHEASAEQNEDVFAPDPNQKIRKKYPCIPKSNAESRDILMELSGDMLQRLFTGPKVIDFGVIFIKSSAEKTFHVKF